MPKRTATNRVALVSFDRRTTISAARFVAPITLVGFTALSVLMSTKASAPNSEATSAVIFVPTTFVRTASCGCDSIMGTCL